MPISFDLLCTCDELITPIITHAPSGGFLIVNVGYLTAAPKNEDSRVQCERFPAFDHLPPVGYERKGDGSVEILFKFKNNKPIKNNHAIFSTNESIQYCSNVFNNFQTYSVAWPGSASRRPGERWGMAKAGWSREGVQLLLLHGHAKQFSFLLFIS